MTLLNRTITYLSAALVVILTVWGVAFYFKMMEEVYDSLDDGLANYKLLIIRKTHDDRYILNKEKFEESNYQLLEVAENVALTAKEEYKDSTMFMEAEMDFEPVRLLTTYFKADNDRYYQLKVVQSMVEEDDLIRSLTYAVILLFVVVVISMFFITKLIVQKIWDPFYKLQQELGKFKLGHTRDFKAPYTSVKEFDSLNKAIENLLADNMQVYEKQKNFIDNASHELQTPLAITTNKVEMLMEQSQDNEQLIEQLYDVLKQLQRMSTLHKTLLLLSKIENKQYIDLEPVDFTSLWRQAIADFSALTAYRSITVEILEKGIFLRRFNPDLARMLVTNLFKNALVHNAAAGGSIHVEITADGFSIRNTGKMEALDAARIFSRFYKESSNSSSTGLGLAIVHAIVKLAGGDISYRYSSPGEHQFKLSFS
ncbi:HAMP domain-containing histidine kinase [Sphingobacteriaceae bacterium WQ 2009]|uniref:histidine kinase n=1 Tax=Rhinopithecimicrobium faecis TaxID=2820698 RepID=A0A8T4HBN1_9SPHI|nr:HAMP domain-containing histidine kinase [Sphingobacteriaceae bacterium WQ 2009]